MIFKRKKDLVKRVEEGKRIDLTEGEALGIKDLNGLFTFYAEKGISTQQIVTSLQECKEKNGSKNYFDNVKKYFYTKYRRK